MFATHDVFTQLKPRHVGRKERKPGARERHSAHRQRHVQDSELSTVCSQKTSVQTTYTVNKTSYAMDSAISEFSRNRGNKRNENVEKDMVTSSYKEVSTIEAIRASMKATAKPKSATPSHIPNWMLNLDINLDVTSVDIISPYDNDQITSEKGETFTETASMTFLDADPGDSNSEDDERVPINRNKNKTLETDSRELVQMKRPDKESVESSRPHSRQNERALSAMDEKRPMSNTFRIAAGFSPTDKENQSPRRYQGDKKVMSMQQGGIRSTPFQPKAKKFINQMITYRHMKHHDLKIKKAKPAIDTKMPSTFKMALERKQLVEQRLSDSWSRTSPTPTPTRSSAENSSKTQSLPRSR